MTVPNEGEQHVNPVSEDPKTEETKNDDGLDQFVVTTNDIDDDDDDENLADKDPESLDARQRKILHWQQSPFAVGCVNVTWADDRTCFRPQKSRSLDPPDSKVCCSAYVCGFLGAGRVGNLAVLAQTTEEYDHVEEINDDNATGEQQQRTTKRKRPKLLCVLGPYWPVNFFLTYPLIIGISFLTGWRNLKGASIAVIATWSFCTFLLLFSLAMVACRNPGVMYRHAERPDDVDDSAQWRWNDQAKTYRPPKARFDPECQAVIEGFDHT